MGDQTIIHEGIGASEGAAALGLDPFKAPIQLWLEKTGKAERFEGNEHTAWGVIREPEIRQFYAEQTGTTIYVPPESRFSQEHPFIRATPDGIIVDDEYESRWVYGLECKAQNSRRAHRWGNAGTDEIPPETMIQCAQGMLVTGLDRWDIAASLGGAPPAFYTLHRDAELEAMIVDGVSRFWNEHVVTDIPPPVDASEQYRQWMAAQYPHVGAEFVRADDQAEVRIAELRDVVVKLKALEERRDLLKNQLLSQVGEARGLMSSHGKVSFAPRRGSPQYKALSEALAARLGMSPASSEYIKLVDEHRGATGRHFSRPQSWTK